MKIHYSKLQSKRRDRGANLMEYALLVSLIAIIAIPSMRSVGTNVDCAFNSAANTLAQASTPNLPFSSPAACAGAAGGSGGSGGGSNSSQQG